jgi:putative membrane protein
MFRVAEVRVETASGSEPEAILRVLSVDEVERLKHQLVRERIGPPDVESADESVDASGQTSRRVLLSITPRELVMLGLISNRGMVLVAIAMGAFYEFDLQERLDWGWAERAARQAWQANLTGAILAGVLIFLAAMAGLRVLSVLWCLLRFHGYCLTMDGDNLRVSAGLLTKVTATVPRRRIQFISIHRPWLARWVGRASIRIETAGGGAQANEDASATIARRWFVPIVKEQEIASLMQELRQGLVWNEDGFPWRPLHQRAGHRLTNKAILVSVLAGLLGLVLVWPFGVLAGPLLLPFFLWHARRYTASLKYARFDDGVVFRSGVLLKKISVTFFDKVQVVEVRQTPFDRRWGMAQLRIDTAAAGPAEHSVHVKLLNRQFARDEFTAIARLAARHRLRC